MFPKEKILDELEEFERKDFAEWLETKELLEEENAELQGA